MGKSYIVVNIVVFLFCFVLSATPPLPIKKSHQVYSLNRQYMLDQNATSEQAVLYKIDGSRKQKLWQRNEWCRWASVSDDGYVAIPNKEASLLLNPDVDMVMLRIISPEGDMVVVQLKQLIFNMKSLRKNVSHFFWGSYKGFDNQGNYLIDTVEKNHFSINPKTGQVIKLNK